jgi:hypothetical protein
MSRVWGYLMKTKFKIAVFQSVLLLAIMFLQTDNAYAYFRGESISITFKEDEKWEATFNYGFCRLFNMAGPSNECTTYSAGLNNALSWEEELGVKGSRKDNHIVYKGQGYQDLESMLNRSNCCESANIEVRTENDGQRIYFSLKERSDHTLNKWDVDVQGDEIISSNGGDFKWSEKIAGWSEYDEFESLSSDPTTTMEAVLIPKADSKLLILGSILVAVLVVSGLSFTAQKIFGWNTVKKGLIIGLVACSGMLGFSVVISAILGLDFWFVSKLPIDIVFLIVAGLIGGGIGWRYTRTTLLGKRTERQISRFLYAVMFALISGGVLVAVYFIVLIAMFFIT